jgi:hypothetical protein
MKIARKYQTGVQFHQAYIDIILRLAGYRLSDLYTSILAYSSFYGTLDKDIKSKLAKEHNTSIQVISNGITRLRKINLLAKNTINRKLALQKNDEISLTLVLGIVNEEQEKSAKQENQPSVSQS